MADARDEPHVVVYFDVNKVRLSHVCVFVLRMHVMEFKCAPSLSSRSLSRPVRSIQTVIMHDPTQGKGLENILNDLLTERAFGRVEQDASGESHWHWNGVSVLQSGGEMSGGAEAENEKDEVSYGRFLRTKARASLARSCV